MLVITDFAGWWHGLGTWEKKGLADDGQVSRAPCHPAQPPSGSSTGCTGARDGPDPPLTYSLAKIAIKSSPLGVF